MEKRCYNNFQSLDSKLEQSMKYMFKVSVNKGNDMTVRIGLLFLATSVPIATGWLDISPGSGLS